MINIKTELSGDITDQLDDFASKVQEAVLISGVAAMAKVIYEEAVLNAGKHVKTGTLRDSIYRTFSKEKSTESMKLYRISWNKKKAPHGHLLEFGTRRAPAYPFIRPAFDRIDEAMNAGREKMKESMDTIKGKL